MRASLVLLLWITSWDGEVRGQAWIWVLLSSKVKPFPVVLTPQPLNVFFKLVQLYIFSVFQWAKKSYVVSGFCHICAKVGLILDPECAPLSLPVSFLSTEPVVIPDHCGFGWKWCDFMNRRILAHLVVLRTYSWLWVQGSLLMDFRDHLSASDQI